FASLRPPTYEGGIANKPADAPAKMPAGASAPAAGFGAGGGRAVGELEKADAMKRLEDRRGDAVNFALKQRAGMERGRGVGSSATAGQLGDFFQYVIDHPVTLPRQKSAMLPIVHKDVEAARVSIYNERTQAKHPLLGLRFKNTTGMHLMQGPITVFEGSSYAGDARILDITPKGERLI